MEDGVVGVVRIDEREPGLWYGSRLGVAPEYRSIRQLSPSVSVRNSLPVYRGLGALVEPDLFTKQFQPLMRLAASSFWPLSNTRMQGSFNGYTGSRLARLIYSGCLTLRCEPI